MFGGGASGRPLGIFHQFGREVPSGAFTLVGAAGFVAVLSEPMSSRLISFAMLGVMPALAARILGWALYQALKSASCSCRIPNSPLPAGRCELARTNYGRQMKTRSRIAVASLKQGRVGALRAAFNADSFRLQTAAIMRIMKGGVRLERDISKIQSRRQFTGGTFWQPARQYAGRAWAPPIKPRV